MFRSTRFYPSQSADMFSIRATQVIVLEALV